MIKNFRSSSRIYQAYQTFLHQFFPGCLAAKKAFETNRKTVNEVMYEVGYADVKAFREVFKKITGLSPLEYKVKYSKIAVAKV